MGKSCLNWRQQADSSWRVYVSQDPDWQHDSISSEIYIDAKDALLQIGKPFFSILSSFAIVVKVLIRAVKATISPGILDRNAMTA